MKDESTGMPEISHTKGNITDLISKKSFNKSKERSLNNCNEEISNIFIVEISNLHILFLDFLPIAQKHFKMMEEDELKLNLKVYQQLLILNSSKRLNLK